MCQASCEDKGYFGRAVNVQEISAVTAACMLMKVEDFEAVGGFDEEFVVAFNDIDLCMKERAAGKKLYLHHMRNFITMNPSQGEWKTHRKNSSVSKRKQNISKRNGANR